MLIREVLGKTITNIYCDYGVQDGWLDTASCYIELDGSLYIDIPEGDADKVYITDLPPGAKSICTDLADIPHYHVNKERKSIGEVATSYQKRKKNIFNRLRRALFGYEVTIPEYQPYKVEYEENKLNHIVHKKIVNYWWETEGFEKGFFELDNGYFISSQYMAPSGTGLAGLHYYENFESLVQRKGDKLARLVE